MTDSSKDDAKQVEYYAAQVNAWFNTKFEHDKSLLTLSAGGVGLLITLLSTTGVKSIESLILYIFALLSFLVCLGVLLWIFRRNSKHLEDVVCGNTTGDQLLKILDNTALTSFLIGVSLSSIIGISTAVHIYFEKEYLMAENKKQITQPTVANESFNGINNMDPNRAKLSVEGITKMNPSNTNSPIPTNSTPLTPVAEKKKQ